VYFGLAAQPLDARGQYVQMVEGQPALAQHLVDPPPLRLCAHAAVPGKASSFGSSAR
jgi:hypothetical protein